MLSLVKIKIALIANRVFFKTLPRSVKMSFMTKGHGQGVLKRKVSVLLLGALRYVNELIN